MAMNFESHIARFQEMIKEEIKSELKANRKKDGKWKDIHHYCLPGQVVAVRSIAPRGKEKRWGNGSITRVVPKHEDGKYFWECI